MGGRLPKTAVLGVKHEGMLYQIAGFAKKKKRALGSMFLSMLSYVIFMVIRLLKREIDLLFIQSASIMAVV